VITVFCDGSTLASLAIMVACFAIVAASLGRVPAWLAIAVACLAIVIARLGRVPAWLRPETVWPGSLVVQQEHVVVWLGYECASLRSLRSRNTWNGRNRLMMGWKTAVTACPEGQRTGVERSESALATARCSQRRKSVRSATS
jgi:hypothetical protein